MEVRYTTEGIHLPELDLWLDPSVPKAAVFLSHGHADHAKGPHGEVLCTEATAEVHRGRGGEGSKHRVVAYGEPVAWRDARLTLEPAGHILGSAQLLVERGDERLVYTGDAKLAAPLCAEPAQVVECDHLIVESTFGLPIFRFLGAEQARARIVAVAREALEAGETPVFLGHALGRGQELVDVLGEAGLDVVAHGAVGRWLDLYRRHAGRAFAARPYERDELEGRVVVVPSSFGRQLARTLARPRLVAVSGWALLDNARARFGADELVPWSDHASFDELVEWVERSRASRIDVVHGHAAAFAAILRRRGLDAQAPEAAARPLDEEEAAP